MKISVGNTQYPGEIEQFAFLKEAGFEKIHVFGDMSFAQADEEVTDRLHFVAVR